jgi:lipoprotein-releasing system permease protein
LPWPGVTVGVAALIATLAVMTGFREDIRAKILGAQPHLLIQPGSDQGLPERDYADRFEGISEVVGWSPYVMGQALAKSDAGTQGRCGQRGGYFAGTARHGFGEPGD